MLEKHLDSLMDREQAELDAALMSAMETAKAEAPVKTGRLRESIHAEVTRQGDVIRGVLTSDAPYAAHVEYGLGGGFMYRAVRLLKTPHLWV